MSARAKPRSTLLTMVIGSVLALIAAYALINIVMFARDAAADSGSGTGSAEATLDAAPAPTPDAAPAAVIVDPTAGTVTPGAGTLPDRLEHDPIGTAKEIVLATKSGNIRFLAAGILAALMVLGIRFNMRIFGKTDRGKAIAVMTLALLGGLSTALATSTALSLSLFIGAAGVAFTAVGGRQWISRVLWPKDGKQYLTWLKPWVGVSS